MKKSELFYFDEPRDIAEIYNASIADCMRINPKFAVTIFMAASVSTTHLCLADDFYQQPIIVAEKDNSLATIEGVESYRIWNRLQEISHLRDGWDGADSKKISPITITKFEEVLYLCNEQQLKDWVLFPDARGYLYLDYSHKGIFAGITLMEDSFVYFILDGTDVKKGDGQLYVPNNVMAILNKVNNV